MLEKDLNRLKVGTDTFQRLFFVIELTLRGVPDNQNILLQRFRRPFNIAPNFSRHKLELKQHNKILPNREQNLAIFRLILFIQQQYIFYPKGYKPFRIRIFGHVQQHLAINAIRREYNIILTHHQKVVIDIRQQPIILNIVIEPIEDQHIHRVVIKVLGNKVPFLELANYMQRRSVDVDPSAHLSRELIFDRRFVIRQRVE